MDCSLTPNSMPAGRFGNQASGRHILDFSRTDGAIKGMPRKTILREYLPLSQPYAKTITFRNPPTHLSIFGRDEDALLFRQMDDPYPGCGE